MTYHGSCHCGAVRFEFDGEITDVYSCDCSLCKKKNARMTTVHQDRFKILQGADKLGLYVWNSGVAQHYFCLACGVYPFHKKRSTPDCYAVNVYCLDDFDPNGFEVRAAEGKGMSLVGQDPRPEWQGPRHAR